jgi:hypothetical protein
MALMPDRKFDPSKPLVVRRMFVAGGRHFNPGDVFDWRRMSIAQRRVTQLFDNGKLTHPEGAAAPVSNLAALQAREMAGAPAPAPVEKTIEQEMQDEDILAATAFEPATAFGDGLDLLDMKALRAIAEEEGAPYRVSRELQREAIRENRRGR